MTRPDRDPERGTDRDDGHEAGDHEPVEESAAPATGAEAARTPATQQIGRVAVLVLLVLFGIFAAANAQPVDFSWVFGSTEVEAGTTGESTGGVPLIVLLLLSFAVGAIVGATVVWQSNRARRREQRSRARTGGPHDPSDRRSDP